MFSTFSSFFFFSLSTRFTAVFPTSFHLVLSSFVCVGSSSIVFSLFLLGPINSVLNLGLLVPVPMLFVAGCLGLLAGFALLLGLVLLLGFALVLVPLFFRLFRSSLFFFIAFVAASIVFCFIFCNFFTVLRLPCFFAINNLLLSRFRSTFLASVSMVLMFPFNVTWETYPFFAASVRLSFSNAILREFRLIFILSLNEPCTAFAVPTTAVLLAFAAFTFILALAFTPSFAACAAFTFIWAFLLTEAFAAFTFILALAFTPSFAACAAFTFILAFLLTKAFAPFALAFAPLFVAFAAFTFILALAFTRLFAACAAFSFIWAILLTEAFAAFT